MIKQRKNTVKTTMYIFFIIAGMILLIFILISSKSKETKFIITCILVWLLFSIFCIYKIIKLTKRKNIFRKGMMSLSDLDDMDGIDFEQLTCDILIANGFEIAQSTQMSADFGVDVLALKDNITYAIQCKRYRETVGIEAVQQVYAGRAYYECHVAVVLTNRYYTSAAQKLADKIGVVLWDRDTLRELLK